MSRVTRGGALLAVVAVAAAALVLADAAVSRGERVLHLSAECSGGTCRARAGEGATIEIPVAPGPRRVGLYAFHPTEFDPPQRFGRLRVGDVEAPAADLVEPASGWRRLDDGSLVHQGAVRDTAVALLRDAAPEPLEVELELRDAVDAGLVLRASDADDGVLLIARPTYNDLFLCRMESGRPGPIVAITSLGEPRAGREALRVAGLAARLLLLGLGLALALRFLARLGPPLSGRFAGDGELRHNAPAWCLLGLFVVTVVVTSWVALGGLGGVPHIDDESAYLFQARILAAGHLWAPVPEHAEFFRHQHVLMRDGRWYAKYPPMFPLLLALGVLAGAPWLVNPVISGLTGLAVYLLARDVAGWHWGVAAWLLALTSPFFVMMGGSMMSHPAAAMFVTWALWFGLRGTRRAGRPGRMAALAAGGCLGAAALTRPYTGLLAAIVIASLFAPALLDSARRRPALGRLALLAAAIVPFVVAYLGWNELLSGGASSNLYAAYDAGDTLGFGPDKGAGWWMSWGSWGHTPAKALRGVHFYLESTSHHLLGWPLRLSPALLVAALIWERRRRVVRAASWLLGALVAGHMLYWAVLFIGYGARYWYAAVPAVLVASLLGLRRLLLPDGGAPRLGAVAVAAILLLLVGWDLAAYWPARWSELPRYGGTTAGLRDEVERRNLDDAVIFVWTEDLIYYEGFGENDPFLRHGPFFVRDLGPRNAELIAAMPFDAPFRWTRGERLEPLVPPAMARHRPTPPRSGR